jgi:pimeloyl-ACP methyl ester carboxylesterase
VPHFIAFNWTEDKDFDNKLKPLIEKVDYLTSQGFLVSVVGISAGASAAVNLYGVRKDKIHKLVLISGKSYGLGNVNESYFINNPAFKKSLTMSTKAVSNLTTSDKRKMRYMHALTDMTVYPAHNQIKGVKNKTILVLGHIPSIYIGLGFYGYWICRFVRGV